MSFDRVAVAPEVLVWGRKAIGLDETAAANKLRVSESTLGKWEAGQLDPTIKQLRKAASVFKVPLAVLLLPEPPDDFQPIRDFRRVDDGHVTAISPELHTELRRAQMQRAVFLELAELAPAAVTETVKPPDLAITDAAESAAQKIRSYLGLAMPQQLAWRSPREALNSVVDAIERNGLIVVHATRVTLDEARGFSISEFPYPVIGLNGADWPRPRLFTLLHELTHIALNLGGLCDLHETQRKKPTDSDRLEHYCNQVAAAAIVPADDLLKLRSVASVDSSHSWPLDQLGPIADRYSISAEALLLRLLSLNKASWETYWNRKAELEEIYAEARVDQKRRQSESPGGPSYYVVKARDIGHGYAHTVLDAYRSRAISSLDVSDYLHVKYNQIPKLEQVLR